MLWAIGTSKFAKAGRLCQRAGRTRSPGGGRWRELQLASYLRSFPAEQARSLCYPRCAGRTRLPEKIAACGPPGGRLQKKAVGVNASVIFVAARASRLKGDGAGGNFGLLSCIHGADPVSSRSRLVSRFDLGSGEFDCLVRVDGATTYTWVSARDCR